MFEIAWRYALGQTSDVKTIDHKTFEGFVGTVVKTIEAQKKNTKLVKKDQAFWFLRGPATRRNNKDLQHSNLIIGDVDDTKISPEACSDLLSSLGRTHFIYTSFSHTKESPRYRIVIPYKSKSQEECRRATQYLQKLLGKIKLANESYTYSQEWYLPINGSEVYGYDSEVAFTIPKKFKGNNKKSKKNKGDDDADSSSYSTHLKHLKEGAGIHTHARGMALALANGGLTEKMILKVIWPEIESACEKRDDVNLPKKLESVTELVRTAVRKVEEEESSIAVETKKIDTFVSSGTKELEWPPGLMGHLSKSVHQYQRYQDKTLAIMTAFCLVAGVAARRHNINELGLSIYVTILADTGRGKDSIAKFINRTLIEANKLNGSKHLGAKGYTGAKALMSALKERPCLVSVITEAAFTLRNRTGSPESLRKTILDVYTKTGRFDVAVGENYSDDQKSIPSVSAPNFTMINESTPKLFLEAMMENDGAEAGDYGRMFVFRVAGVKPYENEKQGYSVSKKVMSRISELIDFNAEIKGDADPEPLVISRPDDYREFSRHCTDMENRYRLQDKMKSALYSRANEKRLRLLGLMCAFDDIEKPNEDMIKWATNTIEYENEGLTRFSEGVGDAIDKQAVLSIGVSMYEALHDDNKNKRMKDGKDVRRLHIVTYGVIRRRAGYKVRHLNDDPSKSKPISGLDKMIRVMLDAGLIEEVSVEELRGSVAGQAKRPGYKMTSELYEELEMHFKK
ncbi:MAG: hypothetical protein GY774_04915 [Planctomycetes bacterium]|nr:hypothetical protein [Planctomycetota bacterium]